MMKTEDIGALQDHGQGRQFVTDAFVCDIHVDYPRSLRRMQQPAGQAAVANLKIALGVDVGLSAGGIVEMHSPISDAELKGADLPYY